MDALSEKGENLFSAKDAVRYKEAFAVWINTRLASAPSPTRVEDLFVDLARVLYVLVAVLSRGALLHFGKHVKDSPLRNVSIVLDFLGRFLPENEHLPEAAKVLDGEPNSTLSLVWWIISHYDGFDGFNSSPTTFKSLTLQWATRRALVAGLAVKKSKERRQEQRQQAVCFDWNDECVQDGRLFLAVLHATDPTRCPFDPIPHDSTGNLFKAFERARVVYAVPEILVADDDLVHSMRQEALVLMYISELRTWLPRLREPSAGGPPLPLGRVWPPQRLFFVDNRFDERSKPSVQAARNSCPTLPFWPPPLSPTPARSPDTLDYTRGETASSSNSDEEVDQHDDDFLNKGEKHRQQLSSSTRTRLPDEIEEQPKDRVRSFRITDATWATKRRTLTMPVVEGTTRTKQKPTHFVFEQAANALIHGARLMSKSCLQKQGKLSQQRQLFADYVCSVVTGKKLELLWEARNAGSMTSVREVLRGLGVDNDNDLSFLAQLLTDPFAMGDAPSLETRTFFDAWKSPRRQRDAATVITERLSLPLARNGLGLYAKRIGESAAALWLAREEGGFRGLESALEDVNLFGETDATARTVFATSLMNPAVLPYNANIVDELLARGMASVVRFASEHEIALCAAREAGGRAAIIRTVKTLLAAMQKDTDNVTSKFACSREDKFWYEDHSMLSRLVAVINDSKRFPTWRSRFDSRAARPPLLRTRAAKVWLRALARKGTELVRKAWGHDCYGQRCSSRSDTARILHGVLAVFDDDGVKAGDYNDCMHSKGSRVQARSHALEIANSKYGTARLDATNSGLSTLCGIDDDSQCLLGIYACDLSAKLPDGCSWQRLQEDDDDRNYPLDYSLALVEFARLHIEQMNYEDVDDIEKVLGSYDMASSLGDGVGLLLLLKSLERFTVEDKGCPRPSGNIATDLMAAVCYAHSVWGTPNVSLLGSEDEEFGSVAKRQRLEAFLTELLIRLPDEAFDDVSLPKIGPHDRKSNETTLDVWITQYQSWRNYVHGISSDATSTLLTGRRKFDQFQDLEISACVLFAFTCLTC